MEKNYDASNIRNNDPLYLVAADVCAVYPSIKRGTIEMALELALKEHSTFNLSGQRILVNLAMHYLNSIIIQYTNKFYIEKQGIISGKNNSVLLANISMHFIMLKIGSTLNQAQLFKRFIDVIIWLSYGNELTEKIKLALTNTCMEYGLRLTFRKVSTNETGKSLEFPDVLHIIDHSNKFQFFTASFIKETAAKRLFLNGISYHPPSIFKSIVFGESIRLRRLNETNELYLKHLERRKKKCVDSYSNKMWWKKIINLAKTWTDRFGPKPLNKNKTTEPILVWASTFSNLLQLSAKEKSLVGLQLQSCISVHQLLPLCSRIIKR